MCAINQIIFGILFKLGVQYTGLISVCYILFAAK
jgi:hypothetical protein